MRLRVCVLPAIVAAAFLAVGVLPRPRPTGFDPPEVILDGSEHGSRLYPQFADFDGDGVTDLVVGVTDRLLVYRNRGTDSRPWYAAPTWFDDGNPSAHIPSG